MTNLQAKKDFLRWLITHESFTRREVFWIVNYLIDHDAILNNLVFVEQAKDTPRGLVIQTKDYDGKALTCWIQGQKLHDSDQIFHEIRFNWKRVLYIECRFLNAWANEQYLAVLQDNPFARWNEAVNPQMLAKVTAYFDQEEKQAVIDQLYQEIDQALSEGNEQLFIHLSNHLNKILTK